MTKAVRNRGATPNKLLSVTNSIIRHTEAYSGSKSSTEGRILLTYLLCDKIITCNQATDAIRETRLSKSLAWHQDCVRDFMTKNDRIAKNAALQRLKKSLQNVCFITDKNKRKRVKRMILNTLTLLVEKRIISEEKALRIINCGVSGIVQIERFRERLKRKILGHSSFLSLNTRT